MNIASRFRRSSFGLAAGGLFVCLTLGTWVSPAAADDPPAQTPPPAPPAGGELPASGSSTMTPTAPPGLAMNIVEDTQPRPDAFTGNYVPLIATVTENGGPTTQDYEVFALARNAAGEKSDTYPCLERSYTSPTTPRGIFWCTVIVDSGGEWTFTAYLNKYRTQGSGEPPTNFGQASVAFNVEAGTLASKGKPKDTVSGSAWEVTTLALHSAFGIGWFFCVAILLLLATAAGRRLLSARGTHIVEQRLDKVVTGTRATTIAVTLSGVYLLFRQTAYDTPSSFSKLGDVFDLPYGKPYFLSLITKIGIYALLIVVSLALTAEARRRSTGLLESDGTRRRRPEKEVDPSDIWSQPWGAERAAAGKGRTGTTVLEEPQVSAVATEPAPEETVPAPVTATAAEEHTADEPTKKAVKIGGLMFVLGGAGIWFCVTLLKYFHELIESASAIVQ